MNNMGGEKLVVPGCCSITLRVRNCILIIGIFEHCVLCWYLQGLVPALWFKTRIVSLCMILCQQEVDL